MTAHDPIRDPSRYRLQDRYTQPAGRVFMTGTQALVRIVLDQARALTFPLPLASAAHQLFLAAAAAGHGGRDDAFVIRFWETLAGITLPEKK